MATISVSVKSRVPMVSALVHGRVAIAITKAAHDIEAHAKSRAPVDTGLLKSSIEAEGSGAEWRVVSPAHYSVYQEFGTSRSAAQPYMLPAVEVVRPSLIAALRRIV